ncbi:hypothetical protein C8J56DRAFT_879508 [Mycena floridula]|nr:hypothetical protein C8J56DRAFT_879508 [Mycena floridula]
MAFYEFVYSDEKLKKHDPILPWDDYLVDPGAAPYNGALVHLEIWGTVEIDGVLLHQVQDARPMDCLRAFTVYSIDDTVYDIVRDNAKSLQVLGVNHNIDLIATGVKLNLGSFEFLVDLSLQLEMSDFADFAKKFDEVSHSSTMRSISLRLNFRLNRIISHGWAQFDKTCSRFDKRVQINLFLFSDGQSIHHSTVSGLIVAKAIRKETPHLMHEASGYTFDLSDDTQGPGGYKYMAYCSKSKRERETIFVNASVMILLASYRTHNLPCSGHCGLDEIEDFSSSDYPRVASNGVAAGRRYVLWYQKSASVSHSWDAMENTIFQADCLPFVDAVFGNFVLMVVNEWNCPVELLDTDISRFCLLIYQECSMGRFTAFPVVFERPKTWGRVGGESLWLTLPPELTDSIVEFLSPDDRFWLATVSNSVFFNVMLDGPQPDNLNFISPKTSGQGFLVALRELSGFSDNKGDSGVLDGAEGLLESFTVLEKKVSISWWPISDREKQIQMKNLKDQKGS